MDALLRRRAMIAAGGGGPTPPVPPSPYDSKVEYLTNTSLGAYINTGIIPTTNTRFILTASDLQDVGGGQLGSRIALNNSMYVMMTPNGGGGLRFDFASNIQTVQGYLSDKYTYGLFGDTRSVLVDGTVVATLTAGTISSNYPIHLFGYNNGGNHASPNYSFKVYRLRLFSADTLLMDLIPVRVGQTGCMFDQVGQTLLYNAGDGQFGFGNDIN